MGTSPAVAAAVVVDDDDDDDDTSFVYMTGDVTSKRVISRTCSHWRTVGLLVPRNTLFC